MKTQHRIFLQKWVPPLFRVLPVLRKIGVFAFLLIIFTQPVSAFDPISANNKFGIHLAQPGTADIKRAAELVNSNGGKWGYITLVIQENDRDVSKWQNIFNELRRQQLIPIIRLATSPVGASWRRPAKEEAPAWADFLNSLIWVVKDRYIVLFNEPNHAAEWGGAVDPENYADLAAEFTKQLKAKDKDFFVMPAGMDAAAPSRAPLFEDEAVFLQKMITRITPQEFSNLFNGWSSHSYPNHGYIGTPYQSGRNTIRNYDWELSLLKQLGVEEELPVFITETGWPHGGNYYSPELVGDYLKIAFEEVWQRDERVRAATPFILNYQGEPFAHFSWLKPGEKEVYPHFTKVQGLSKQTGYPEAYEKGTISASLPRKLLILSTYHFKIKVANQGQTIWDRDKGYRVQLDGINNASYAISDLKQVEPGQARTLDLYLTTNEKPENLRVILSLHKLEPVLGDTKVLGQTLIDAEPWSFEKENSYMLKFKYKIDLNKDGEINIDDLKEIFKAF